MRRSNFNKIVITTIGLFVVVILAVSFYLVNSPSEETSHETITLSEDVDIKKVFIKDFDTLKGSIDTETEEYIQRKIYYLADNSGPDLFTGVIRQDSYSKTLANKVTTIRFLVDVMPINITYLVTVVTLDGNASITVGCAPKEQQLNQSAICENSEYS